MRSRSVSSSSSEKPQKKGCPGRLRRLQLPEQEALLLLEVLGPKEHAFGPDDFALPDHGG
jgi:hypothetical protein